MTDWLSLALAADPTPFISLICLALAAAGLLWGACWRHTANQTAGRAERLLRRAKAAEARVDLLDEAMAHLERDHAAEIDRLLVDHENHLARCLGELTHQNDGVLP